MSEKNEIIANDKLVQLAEELKLFYLSKNIDILNKEIVEKNLSPKAALEFILEEELKDRQKRFSENRVARAKISQDLSLDNFNFNLLSLNEETLIKNIMNTQFTENNTNFLLVGNHGVGKTHLGSAIVRKACFNEKTGYAESVKDMCRKLVLSHKLGNWYEVAKVYLECDILFLQDVATIPLELDEVAALYEIVAQREGHGCIIIETCVSTKDWFNRMADDDVLVSGILERLQKNCIVIKFEGKSRRLEDKKK